MLLKRIPSPALLWQSRLLFIHYIRYSGWHPSLNFFPSSSKWRVESLGFHLHMESSLIKKSFYLILSSECKRWPLSNSIWSRKILWTPILSFLLHSFMPLWFYFPLPSSVSSDSEIYETLPFLFVMHLPMISWTFEKVKEDTFDSKSYVFLYISYWQCWGLVALCKQPQTQGH